VKSRLSAASWEARVAEAQRAERTIKQLLATVERGASLNEAIAKHLPARRRGWALRQVGRYREEGFDGLIDTRMPREPRISGTCSDLLQGARQANPRLTVEEAEDILSVQGVVPMPSPRTIKREFMRADAKRRAAWKRAKRRAAPSRQVSTIDLPYAGGELMLAAEAETDAVAALTAAIVKVGELARRAAKGRRPSRDRRYRSRRGYFTRVYNRARRRKAGEEIAWYLHPAEEKAKGRVPSWPRFVHEDAASIGAKLWMLTFSSVMMGTTGWGALRSPDMAGLESIAGYAYMPSTLAKMISAMAIAGLGRPLLQVVAETWHRVAQERWGEPGAMAAIYIDNHAKEVWSSLFTQAGKVSHRTRVMPCITTTFAQTGAGTPVVLSVQSGSAPLAPRLFDLVEQAEATLEGQVKRALVIDAEGSTFDVLESFDKANRVIVTPLRPSRAPELELSYTRGSYYRPYRDKDELRVATCTLRHKMSGRTLDKLGALMVRRPHRDNDIVLLTTGLRLGFEGRDLADLYFRRWPVQENYFKYAVVLGINRHRGNCGRMVANVAVVTEIEQLEQRIKRDRTTYAERVSASDALAHAAAADKKADARAQALLATRRRRLDEIIAEGRTQGRAFARATVDHHQALAHAEQCTAAAKNAIDTLKRNQTQQKTLAERLATDKARRKHLEPQRKIRQLDVAQEMILTAMKLTAAQLIAFALREYLVSMPMTTETFALRVFSIRGRKEVADEEERVFFYANPRDPPVTVALREACRRLNKRRIQRAGRRIRYQVEVPPAATDVANRII
jgi:hypothetical protein